MESSLMDPQWEKSQIYKCDTQLKVTLAIDITRNNFRATKTGNKIPLQTTNNRLIMEK